MCYPNFKASYNHGDISCWIPLGMCYLNFKASYNGCNRLPTFEWGMYYPNFKASYNRMINLPFNKKPRIPDRKRDTWQNKRKKIKIQTLPDECYRQNLKRNLHSEQVL